MTPERVIYSGESTMVVTRTLSGEVAFLPHHAPFLGALVENHTRIYVEDERVEDIAVLGGFVEVSNNRVTILAEQAELAEEIDIDARPPRARGSRAPGAQQRRSRDPGRAAPAPGPRRRRRRLTRPTRAPRPVVVGPPPAARIVHGRSRRNEYGRDRP